MGEAWAGRAGPLSGHEGVIKPADGRTVEEIQGCPSVYWSDWRAFVQMAVTVLRTEHYCNPSDTFTLRLIQHASVLSQRLWFMLHWQRGEDEPVCFFMTCSVLIVIIYQILVILAKTHKQMFRLQMHPFLNKRFNFKAKGSFTERY